MKIIQLIDSLSIGGAERMVINISNALNEHNIESKIIATRKGGPLEVFLKKQNTLKILNKRSLLDVIAFIKFFKEIKSFQPDILHCHSNSIFWGWLAKFLSPSIKLVFHDHNGNRGDDGDKVAFWLKLISYKIDGLIAVNSKLLGWAKKNLKIDKYIYIKNFVYFDSTELSPLQDRKSILCVANLRHPKNHHMMIEVFSNLIIRYPQLRLTLVGSIEKEGSYYISLIQLIKDKNLEKEILIEGPQTSLIEYYNNALVAVVTSDYEGLPMSLLEYGLARLPVVCTNVGECAEVLENGKCGWLVEPGDNLYMAKAIVEAIENEDEISKIKAKNFEDRVRNEYGVNGFVKEYMAFTNLLENKGF